MPFKKQRIASGKRTMPAPKVRATEVTLPPRVKAKGKTPAY